MAIKMKGFRKKIMAMLAVTVLCTGMLAGCSTEQEKITHFEKEEEVQLEVWAFFDMNQPGNHYVEAWQELAKSFHYDVDVKLYSNEQMKGKIRMALACKEMPDIFLVWGGTYPDYLIDANACLPVQDYLATVPYEESYVVPYADGNNYIIPCLTESYAVMYYNQLLVDQIRLTVPTNWEEMLSLVEQVSDYNTSHATKYVAFNIGVKDEWLGELLYCMLVNRLDPTAYDRLKAGEITFEDPVFCEAAERVRQLVDSYALPSDYVEIGEAESVERFIEGESVLSFGQTASVYHILENMPEDSFHVMAFPACAEGEDADYSQYMMDVNHNLTAGLCVSASSAHPDEAARLCIAFSKWVNQINVENYGDLSLTRELFVLPEPLPEPIMEFRNLVESAEKMTPDWYAELPQTTGNNWRNLTKKLFAGEVDVDTFIAEGTKLLSFEP